jgi:hypothetical protein
MSGPNNFSSQHNSGHRLTSSHSDRHSSSISLYGQSGSRRRNAADDEKTAYAINLQLKPVEMGIRVINTHPQLLIQGLGAFNRYFGLLLPQDGIGYTIPDIWDGFFHITLAKFGTHQKPERLEEIFREFHPPVDRLPHIPDVPFRSSRIYQASGDHRQGSRRRIDFIMLSIDLDEPIKEFYDRVQPLLEQIKALIQPYDWNLTALNGLHLTIRKYSNMSMDISSIPIVQYPIEFRCACLEVKQTREQARMRYQRANPIGSYQWWSGMTDINSQCSNCQAPLTPNSWQGFCVTCGQYESIIPLWSTPGSRPLD